MPRDGAKKRPWYRRREGQFGEIFRQRASGVKGFRAKITGNMVVWTLRSLEKQGESLSDPGSIPGSSTKMCWNLSQIQKGSAGKR